MEWADLFQKHLSKGIGLWSCTLVTLLIPFALCFFLPYTYFDSSPYDFVANLPNDLSDNWHETDSFRIHGFQTGYYSAYENPPRAGFTRFGVHGPIYPVVMGTLAKVFGWKNHSPVFYNAAFVSMALLLFIFLVRPNGVQMALLAVMTLTFWPIHLLVPTAYQESLHHAGAIVLVALGHRYLKERTGKKPYWAASILFLLLFFSLLRISWGFFLIPLFYLELRRLGFRFPTIFSGLAGLALIFLISKLNGYVSAPGHNVVTGALASLLSNPAPAMRDILATLSGNLRIYFLQPPLNLLLRIEILALALAFPIFYFTKKKPFLGESALYSFLAATILFPSVLLYIDVGFYRVFSIVFVFVAFGLLAAQRVLPVLAIAILHSFASFGLAQAVEEWQPNLAIDPALVAKTREVLHQHLRYAAPPASPWCNTIMSSFLSFNYRVAQAPAGFGLSTYNPMRTPHGSFKSKYVLLTAQEHEAFQDKSNFEFLALLPDRNLALFRNTRSACN